jgi:hypothetical protein
MSNSAYIIASSIIVASTAAAACVYLYLSNRSETQKSSDIPPTTSAVQILNPDFQNAVHIVSTASSLLKVKSISQDQQLKLYGLYKQSTLGPLRAQGET